LVVEKRRAETPDTLSLLPTKAVNTVTAELELDISCGINDTVTDASQSLASPNVQRFGDNRLRVTFVQFVKIRGVKNSICLLERSNLGATLRDAHPSVF
jgi:hypothetical protein